MVCSVFLLGLYFDATTELLDPLHLHSNVQTGISSIEYFPFDVEGHGFVMIADPLALIVRSKPSQTSV